MPAFVSGTWVKIEIGNLFEREACGIFLDCDSENYADALPQIQDRFVSKLELTPTARSSLERMAAAGKSVIMKCNPRRQSELKEHVHDYCRAINVVRLEQVGLCEGAEKTLSRRRRCGGHQQDL